MINFANGHLFEQDSIEKQLHIRFDNTEITNAELYAEEFELNESLCSKERLTFGSCEASHIRFKVGNVFGSLKGKTLRVSISVGGESDELPLGIFKVDTDRPDADRNYREVEAYDAMVDILNADVTAWYSGLSFPMTLKNFRNSFFNHLGITQVATDLVNDSLTVRKTMDAEVLSGATVITSICEINGVFGHINRQGQFEYKSLVPITVGLYPSDNLYPSDVLYPSGTDSYNIYSNMRISANCEDYLTQKITKLQIRNEENEIGKTVGSGDNAYVVEGNPLAWDKSTPELTTIANNLLAQIRDISYKPCEVTSIGNPCVEVGDAFITTGAMQRIESYVLERHLKGVQALQDTFVANGEETYDEKVNAVEESIIRLNGKGNILKRDVESLTSEIYDENGRSKIAQTAHSIQLTVSKGVSTCGITIKLKNADGEEIDSETGDIQMTGMVTFNALSRAGQTVINGSNITTGTIDASLLSVSIPDDDDITLITNNTLATTNVVAKNLHVKSANIDGEIVAKSLSVTGLSASSSGVNIAGFDVDDYRIKTPNSEVSTSNPGLAIQKSGSGTYAFAIGFTTYTSYANAPFRVTHAGKLYASNAEISGKITASSGSVGGWTINTASLTNGLATLTSGKLEITNNEGGNNTLINYEGVTADTVKPTKIRCTFEGSSRDLTPIAVTIGSSRYLVYGQKL